MACGRFFALWIRISREERQISNRTPKEFYRSILILAERQMIKGPELACAMDEMAKDEGLPEQTLPPWGADDARTIEKLAATSARRNTVTGFKGKKPRRFRRSYPISKAPK